MKTMLIAYGKQFKNKIYSNKPKFPLSEIIHEHRNQDDLINNVFKFFTCGKALKRYSFNDIKKMRRKGINMQNASYDHSQLQSNEQTEMLGEENTISLILNKQKSHSEIELFESWIRNKRDDLTSPVRLDKDRKKKKTPIMYRFTPRLGIVPDEPEVKAFMSDKEQYVKINKSHSSQFSSSSEDEETLKLK